MLKLTDVTKIYRMGNENIPALKKVDLEFRKNEFVSVLGPSGCGKTTLLNIIGGLDQYTSGDLLINEKSTKNFKDKDWDAYRNHSVGMVFQSYNLIPHLTVLENVSLALTLSGVGTADRKQRAMQALIDVGLENQTRKKPNQLSGGQMQRVAIARALVNNPEILLADEPTGALDTKTSVQVLEILKKVSSDRLVIMVTHNEQLAEAYSDRIIKLVDGVVVDDTNKYKKDKPEIILDAERLKQKKTSMSFFAALKNSFKNLMTKKGRTVITSIAGSIGILSIALVLSISNGMTSYINSMQRDTLAGFPITISPVATSFTGGFNDSREEFPDTNKLYYYDTSALSTTHVNNITDDYIAYLEKMDTSLYNSVTYSYGLSMNVITKTNIGGYSKVNTASSSSLLGGSSSFSELPDNEEFVLSQYDILAGSYPKSKNELILVVDRYNGLSDRTLAALGIINKTDVYNYSDLLGHELKIIDNNTYYYYDSVEDYYKENENLGTMYSSGESLTIKGILRIKESASSELLSTGVGYTADLTKAMLDLAQASDIVNAQKISPTINVLGGEAFNATTTYNSVMLKIGGIATPTGVQIYPKNFDSKDSIRTYLDAYNTGKADANKIVYTDLAEAITSITGTLITTITVILAAFAAISLVVSSIMIGIITYVSVVERTKEIGILRAIGARKRDVSRLFNAETVLIGFAAGLIGVVFGLMLLLPINAIINSFIGISGFAIMPIWAIFGLIALSMGLTFIAGLIPSKAAAKKDPVICLRTE